MPWKYECGIPIFHYFPHHTTVIRPNWTCSSNLTYFIFHLQLFVQTVPANVLTPFTLSSKKSQAFKTLSIPQKCPLVKHELLSLLSRRASCSRGLPACGRRPPPLPGQGLSLQGRSAGKPLGKYLLNHILQRSLKCLEVNFPIPPVFLGYASAVALRLNVSKASVLLSVPVWTLSPLQRVQTENPALTGAKCSMTTGLPAPPGEGYPPG